MGGSTLLKLTAVCLISSTVPSAYALSLAVASAQEVGLLSRAATCGGKSGYTQCGGSFPKDFCCGTNTKCVGFDAGGGANTGAVCCPSGNCAVFQAITCNSALFNATLHPDNPIHLSSIPANLVTCNDKCCPPGYKCSGPNCVLDTPSASSTAAAQSTTLSLSSAVGTSSPTSHPVSTSNGASSSAQTTSPNSATSHTSCRAFPAPAVLVGFFPGMIAGSIITFLLIIFVGRRRDGSGKDSDSSLGPVRAHISDPIYQGQPERIDFLRRNTRTKMPPSPGESGASSPPLARVRSLFSRTPTLSREKFDPGLGVSGAGTSPRTPDRKLRREPSTESIPIMSPPESRRGLEPSDHPGDRQTTFGDVLKAVGLSVKDPMPYMGSPGMVDPRSRGVDDGRIRR